MTAISNFETSPKLKEWVEKNKGAYIGFGTASQLFEMIPVASIFFTFTNHVGAALWAVDIEKGKKVAPEKFGKAINSINSDVHERVKVENREE